MRESCTKTTRPLVFYMETSIFVYHLHWKKPTRIILINSVMSSDRLYVIFEKKSLCVTLFLLSRSKSYK